ncbi:urea carboxylase [Vibrio methylphosphonaticus]|uniref:urea carboxylase n=1 Tax=Vibrio methylphosphonaticus TaxID=2946866 RepID=UPI00202A0F28|nr:urea carboxylase [Vibrio methylphosphonaticus]MCL9773566.1 urea carboxylase [Vibrio methylphosphonaticus]
MFSKVLIANRGAIACRVIRTLKQLSIESVAVYSDADSQSLHVVDADVAFSLGKGGASETYLDQDKIISAAKQSGAQAIHPGYGFLSENPEFVERCEQEGLVFLGPTAQQMRSFGLKHSARNIATQANVPLLPGTDLLKNKQQALTEAESIGYPVMLKSTAGGGGIGMQCCFTSDELEQAFDSVKRLSENNFSNSGVFLEKFIQQARHIEVQIFGDGQGQVVALGERDCSAQRRNQKVIEETPAPNLSDEIRAELQNTAIRLASEVKYRNAGTIEFVLDQQSQAFYFLEVNTRLQVEHGVTEEVFGVDLVEWMIRQGAGQLDLASLDTDLKSTGHAIQARLYAEDANKNFQPCAGLLSQVEWAQQDNLRIEHWIEAGIEVSPFFDPMLAKMIVHAKDRETALTELKQGLDNSAIYGIEHNQAYLSQLLSSDLVKKGEVLTQSLNAFEFKPNTFDVLSGGTQTTIQDYPARTGYWDIGVPPSGAMDSLSFRLANALLGNHESCAGLEVIVSGPTLKFNQATSVALTGASIQASLDGEPVSMNTRLCVEPGQTLKLGKVLDGARTYLALQGGIDCPEYLGSRSTFTLGQFGGHAGRALVAGDVLHINQATPSAVPQIPSIKQPAFNGEWEIRVIYGPHGAPDFFTQQDIDTFFDAEWKVHFNSSRTGVRLIGPKPNWARTDGGEAGLHPSNIHDNAYAVGTIDFTGDMPVILGPDGPSLGGFVCPATIIKADLWKVGQLKAGDKIRFTPVAVEDAEIAERAQLTQIQTGMIDEVAIPSSELSSPIIKTIPAQRYGEQVVYRPSGEDYLLVEYGPQVLDIRLRFRVHALMIKLQQQALVGVEELTPGIRSLQIHYDNLVLSRDQLLIELEAIEAELDNIDELIVPARVVHLPLSWDDEATRLAIRKYDEVVRKDAPWCPDNIEFIRRINGLDSIDDVKKIVFDASYLVMGLGDVYLGAPVATPMDPRHRLVTTKYNPARTWTPENAVGIGGAYMCVYGMEGPGGYQFVGRTLQMWNRYRQTEAFSNPWLLRFFDQIKFYEVSAEELLDIREQHPLGHYPVKIEETEFSLATYQSLLEEHADEIKLCKTRQQKAFEEERQRWEASGQANFVATEIEQSLVQTELEEGQEAIESHVAANIWQVLVEPGQHVKENDVVMILEAMKMELEVTASVAGIVDSICHDAGAQVHAGEPLLVVNT